MTKKIRQPNRIDTSTDVVLRDAARFSERLNWKNNAQKALYEKGIALNETREYGKEYIGWLMACMSFLGIKKGWTFQRFIRYLNDEKKYQEKLGKLKERRLATPTQRIPVDAAKDFLAEAKERDAQRVVPATDNPV